MPAVLLPMRPLMRETFSAFGDVIETEGRQHHSINQGHAQRYHDLAGVDVAEDGGRALINIFRAMPWPRPIRIRSMERHPLSSQAFVPLTSVPFLVVVAAPADQLRPDDLRAFITNGRQGVNYHRGVWHHPLLAILETCDFLVVDRGGAGTNCEEVFFEPEEILVDYPATRG
jgi:ureidoglycolate lyase